MYFVNINDNNNNNTKTWGAVTPILIWWNPTFYMKLLMRLPRCVPWSECAHDRHSVHLVHMFTEFTLCTWHHLQQPGTNPPDPIILKAWISKLQTFLDPVFTSNQTKQGKRKQAETAESVCAFASPWMPIWDIEKSVNNGQFTIMNVFYWTFYWIFN